MFMTSWKESSTASVADRPVVSLSGEFQLPLMPNSFQYDHEQNECNHMLEIPAASDHDQIT